MPQGTVLGPPDVKATAYNAIVHPHLNYASACWSPYTKKNIDKIEAVQRRAARFTLNYHIYGTDAQLTQKIKSLNWLPLHHQHCIHDLQIFNKIRNNMLNILFPEIVLSTTRNPLKYETIQCLHSEAFKNQFFIRTVQIWNSLPSEIMNCVREDKFKAAVAEWLPPH